MAVKPVKVSQLNSYIKRIFSTDPLLGNLSVIGEISNLKHHGSGHVYFTLKDEGGKINCFLPDTVFSSLRFELVDGMEITAEGYIYLYEKGGTYSLNIRNVTVAGLGNLSIAFEKLKEKLKSEGLFDERHKKQLPFFPKKIAILTSETGAAVQDMLKIIKSRNNVVDVLIFPVLVQGQDAAKDIASAIEKVNLHFPETDIIIVGRGGGSIEELWAFNEEIVARSIFASTIPVISAVGHETDITIADFVADRRAETPTAAAAMAAPNISEIKEHLNSIRADIDNRLNFKINASELRIERCNIEALRLHILSKINLLRLNIDVKHKELFAITENLLYNREMEIISLKKEVMALSPKDIMKRGYSVILGNDGILKTSTSAIKPEEQLSVVMSDGRLNCTVDEILTD